MWGQPPSAVQRSEASVSVERTLLPTSRNPPHRNCLSFRAKRGISFSAAQRVPTLRTFRKITSVNLTYPTDAPHAENRSRNLLPTPDPAASTPLPPPLGCRLQPESNQPHYRPLRHLAPRIRRNHPHRTKIRPPFPYSRQRLPRSRRIPDRPNLWPQQPLGPKRPDRRQRRTRNPPHKTSSLVPHRSPRPHPPPLPPRSPNRPATRRRHRLPPSLQQPNKVAHVKGEIFLSFRAKRESSVPSLSVAPPL